MKKSRKSTTPKFKVGDWCKWRGLFDADIAEITEICGGEYKYTIHSKYGSSEHPGVRFDHFEKILYRLTKLELALR